MGPDSREFPEILKCISNGVKTRWPNEGYASSLHDTIFKYKTLKSVEKFFNSESSYMKNTGDICFCLQSAMNNCLRLYDDDDETDQQDINWNHLAQDFDGFSGDALQKIFADMLHEHVPVNLHNDFRASVSYLKNDCLEIYKKQVGSSNFVYKDGILSIC